MGGHGPARQARYITQGVQVQTIVVLPPRCAGLVLFKHPIPCALLVQVIGKRQPGGSRTHNDDGNVQRRCWANQGILPVLGGWCNVTHPAYARLNQQIREHRHQQRLEHPAMGSRVIPLPIAHG